MTGDITRNNYFEWLLNLACGARYSKQISFRKLLMHLHNTEFTYILPMDENRALDGISMRNKYAYDHGYEDHMGDILEDLDGPCSVLEMMIGLASRCEETMDDPEKGDRTGQWFWRMVTNLGLGGMTDARYDKDEVTYILNRFLRREYDRDGRGGLFTVKDPPTDLRKVEIWYQLWWSLDEIS